MEAGMAVEQQDSAPAISSFQDDGSRRWVPVLETGVAVVVVATILYVLSYHPTQKFETNSILLAILPVIFWLIISGRVTAFKGFGIEFKSEVQRLSDISIAADRNLLETARIDFEPAVPAPKIDVREINKYIARKIPALSFELGRTNYYKPAAIQQYLNALTPHSFFRWVVFQDRNGEFRGLAKAQNLHAFCQQSRQSGRGYQSIRDKIESGQIDDVPGVITSEYALNTNDTKKEAIEQFSKTDADDLPVTDNQGKFVGVLNRGKLTTNMLNSVLRAASR
jgi:hypothetical protein